MPSAPDAGSGTGMGTGGSSGPPGSSYCAPCTVDADCGGGNNFCLGFSFGDYCGTDCSAGQACPTNTRCAGIADAAGNPVGMNCAPLSGDTCASAGSGTTGGTGAGSAGSSYCAACTADADCGGGNNFCLGFSFGNYCGADCGAGQACPTNTRCAQITDAAGNPVGMNCAPLAGDTCASAGGSGSGSGSGSGGSTCTMDTYAGWPSTFFSSHCSSCHYHAGQFGHSDVSSRTRSISSYISSGYMPRGETLTSADRSRILTYLGCGAP